MTQEPEEEKRVIEVRAQRCGTHLRSGPDSPRLPAAEDRTVRRALPHDEPGQELLHALQRVPQVRARARPRPTVEGQ